MEEDDRVCLLRDLDLFLVRGRDECSEFASLMVGRFANGIMVPSGPGLADLERRGQAMARIPLWYVERAAAMLSLSWLSLRHTKRELGEADSVGVDVRQWGGSDVLRLYVE